MKSKKNKEAYIQYALYLTAGFIIFSATLSFWNRSVTYDTQRIVEQSRQTKQAIQTIETDILYQLNLAAYGYLITHDEIFLHRFDAIIDEKDSVFRLIATNLTKQHYDKSKLSTLESNINQYVRSISSLIKQSSVMDSAMIVKTFLQSQAFQDLSSHKKFSGEIVNFEEALEASAQSDYDWSILDNAIIQIILILLSIPILVIASTRLKREVKTRNKLLKDLHDSNSTHLFNTGEGLSQDSNAVVEKTINSLKKASQFIELVSTSNFKEAQNLIPENIRALNEKTLMGALLRMSERMEQNEQNDVLRQWTADSLNEFYTIVRNNQEDLSILAERTTSFLTQKLNAQQGSLFTLGIHEGEPVLELVSCFAFDKKKWIEKRIDIGQGLVGQVYLEREHVLLLDIPNGYTTITSGLGHATPTAILLVPLIYNDKVEAVFEVAAFHHFSANEIEFLKKAGEFLASALQAVTNTKQMQLLLQQSMEQSEALKAQEEELRQNMEELEATNEAMTRKEKELQPQNTREDHNF